MIFSKELDDGNIEYKRYFKIESNLKLQNYTTQMNYRINEGNGIR